MKYTIRPANEGDFDSMFEMIQELAEFEKEPDAVINSVEKMKAEKDHFNALVAEVDGEVVAMGIYFFAYYTWVGKSLYLDDLYVKAPFRGTGIGTALLDELFEIAKESSCRRIRWQVLDWNDPAIKVYEKIGAKIDGGWNNCDIDHVQIKNFRKG